MYDRHGVRLSLIHSLPVIAERHGARLGLVLSRGGLDGDAVDWDNQVVTRSQVCAMMTGLARLTGDATIGVQMAARTDARRLGPLGLSLSIGRTLREGLRMLRRYMPSLQRGVQISLIEDGQRATWVHRSLDSDPIQARLLNEGIAAFTVQFMRAISGDGAARMHVTLPHRPLVPPRFYEDALGCAVSFVQGRDLIIQFDAGLLDRPNALRGLSEAVTTIPRLSGRVDALPRDCLLDGENLLGSLHRQIEAAALMGKVSELDACHSLGMSPRTLQRRLAEMDTTFEDLVDRWRRRTAIALMADPTQRTGLIAAQLGYTDPAHFVRAFRRWEGVAPSEFRLRRGIAITYAVS